MKLIYLYDEFMRPPEGIKDQTIYIIDDKLNEDMKLVKKFQLIGIFLAEQTGLKYIRETPKKF